MDKSANFLSTQTARRRCFMRMPGFFAEVSLYRSGNNYRMAGAFGQPEGVAPALPPLSFGGAYGPGGPSPRLLCELKCRASQCGHSPSTACVESCSKQCTPGEVPW